MRKGVNKFDENVIVEIIKLFRNDYLKDVLIKKCFIPIFR